MPEFLFRMRYLGLKGQEKVLGGKAGLLQRVLTSNHVLAVPTLLDGLLQSISVSRSSSDDKVYFDASDCLMLSYQVGSMKDHSIGIVGICHFNSPFKAVVFHHKGSLFPYTLLMRLIYLKLCLKGVLCGKRWICLPF